MTKVTILPVELSANVQPGESLLDAGERAGVEMQVGCFECSCGDCVVEVISGMAQLTPPTREELEVLNRWSRDPVRFRLACCTRIVSTDTGPVVIRQPD
jgi:2Fe-2S ferredoxin